MENAMQPKIIPRTEHRISRKQINPYVLRTLYRLRDNGFIAYLIGGCVRDLLLERTPKDFDIVTDATPGQIKRLFRNCRLVGRRFRLAHLYYQDQILEVSTFRAAAPDDEGETPDQDDRPPRHLKDQAGMVLCDNVFGTPQEDALRRDFTINALAYNIADFSVIDYADGLSDLSAGMIRTIGDPYIRFTEDPVRMLRAVRFAASHNFVIENGAWRSLCHLSWTISRATPGRLYEEMLKLFLMGAGCRVFELMETSGLLLPVFPALSQWLSAKSDHRKALCLSLNNIDQQCRAGIPPSPALFFAIFFGPCLEEKIYLRHREGIPYAQALDEICAVFLKECSQTVNIPGRVGNQMRGIMTLRHFIRRLPPRRPANLAARPEFTDALAFLRLGAGDDRKCLAALSWWDAYLARTTAPEPDLQDVEKTSTKKRRKRKRRRRPAASLTLSSEVIVEEE